MSTTGTTRWIQCYANAIATPFRALPRSIVEMEPFQLAHTGAVVGPVPGVQSAADDEPDCVPHVSPGGASSGGRVGAGAIASSIGADPGAVSGKNLSMRSKRSWNSPSEMRRYGFTSRAASTSCFTSSASGGEREKRRCGHCA
jgi:hypothetical protein